MKINVSNYNEVGPAAIKALLEIGATIERNREFYGVSALAFSGILNGEAVNVRTCDLIILNGTVYSVACAPSDYFSKEIEVEI